MKLIKCLILLFVFTSNIWSQNCLKCIDTPFESVQNITFLKSKFHLIQLFGDINQRKTNLYRSNYNGSVAWVESRVIFPYLSEIIETKIPLPDPYFTGIVKNLKDIYWEERFDYGIGIEWRLFKNIKNNIYPINWIKHIRIYNIWLNTYYLDVFDNWRPTSDYRFGAEIYRECNLYKDYDNDETKDDDYYLWGEYWMDASYRKTNFFINNYNSWMFAFVPKIGTKLFPYKYYTLFPYFTSEVILTEKTNFWQNRFSLGVGLRIMPFRKFSNGISGNIIRSMKLYIETQKVLYYFKEAPSSGIPNYDIYFGINMSINKW